MDVEPDLYAVGKIVKAHGIKGDVVVQPMTGSVKRFLKLKHAFLGKTATSAREVTVERVHVQERGVRLKLAGIDDRTSAEELRGEVLFVDKQERLRLPHGTYFVHDVIGLQVVDEEGKPLGIVKDVLPLPAHDVYVIDVEGRDIMVPAVKEFIRKIDMNRRTMEVRLIEGMAE